MVTKQCEQFSVAFAYEPPKDFPDNRKYCDKCSAAKKADYEAWKAKQNAVSTPAPVENTPEKPVEAKPFPPVQVTDAQAIVNVTDKPNSYECGKAGNRHKIYYDSVPELREKIAELKLAGLMDDPDGFEPGAEIQR